MAMRQTTPLHKVFLATILILIVSVVYLPSLRNTFIWDDDYYVTENKTLETFSGLKAIWATPTASPQYYPMVFTSFWIEYQLFGLKPVVFHATNIFLHAVNALLVWLILRRLQIPWAWFASILFAVHPLNVESVAWISERKNVLSGLFALSSFLILIRLYLTGPHEAHSAFAPERRRQAAYTISLLLFILALLSKSVVCVMPAVFLIVLWWKKNGHSIRRMLIVTAPFFIAGLAAGLHTAYIEKTHVGALGPEWDFNIMERILIAGRSLWFYAYKLIYPAKLIFIYPRWEVDTTVWWQYIFPIAALILSFALWATRHRIGRGPFAGMAIFTSILLPALGLISYYPMIYSFVADHFQYMAGTALFALFACGISRLMVKSSEPIKLSGYGLSFCLLLLLGVRTWHEQDKYRDSQSLWEDTIARNPSCWLAHNNLSCVLSSQGRFDESATRLRMLLASKPDLFRPVKHLVLLYKKRQEYDSAIQTLENFLAVEPEGLATMEYRACLPDAYVELGTLLHLTGRVDRAVDAFSRALTITPDDAVARYHLARLFLETGRFEKALIHYNYLQNIPSLASELLANVHNDLGVISIRGDDLDAAADHFEKALTCRAEFAEVYNNIGLLRNRRGQASEAVDAFSKAVAINPDYWDARYNLAETLAGKKDMAGAKLHYEYILERRAAVSTLLLANVHNDMGVILAAQGRLDEAVRHFSDALELHPEFPEVHNNLGLAFLSRDRLENAVIHFTAALVINPGYPDAANNLAITYGSMEMYDKALNTLESLLPLHPESAASISYNIACVHAIRGDTAASVAWLEKAIDSGFNLWGLIETDKDLENIRKTESYKKLRERIRRDQSPGK